MKVFERIPQYPGHNDVRAEGTYQEVRRAAGRTLRVLRAKGFRVYTEVRGELWTAFAPQGVSDVAHMRMVSNDGGRYQIRGDR